MYFIAEKQQLLNNGQSIGMVEPVLCQTLQHALLFYHPDIMRSNCEVSVFKVPDGYTSAERILIARLNWKGVSK